jgi:hypothetical protein
MKVTGDFFIPYWQHLLYVCILSFFVAMKYNLFKKLLVCIIFLQIPIHGFSQVYEPAVIITLYGDSINCQLKHIRFISGKTEFRYKTSLDDKKDLFINSKDVLWIYTARDTFECLLNDKGVNKGLVLAYKLLADGELRLYEQYHHGKTQASLQSTFYIKKKEFRLQEISVMDYKKHLMFYTKDAVGLNEKIEQVKFTEESLKHFVNEYNEWQKTLDKNE